MQEERARLVAEKIRAEDERETLATKDAREIIGELLTQKGYLPGDLEIDREFSIRAGGREDTASVDYIVRLEGRRYMAVKCSMALESRERHVLAFGRVVDRYQIPYCVITDGLTARLMDTQSGKTLSEELDAIPSREEALRDIWTLEFRECPPERKAKETRILLAFECAACPKPGGG